ncbi:MAG: hypothetical protein COU10_03390 [Candidatus Harrisonbacteria bacterium CG10_big_fil_rev_8_21_14_0_10_45_28]|uniref:Glycosyl transferase family 1 domain-containing protein n=1 Tax=Candidatus Harrisonbacteria bacterium CG10_big_fil_rev_8_21_14_0_10_45_28 TaxID=1974586 RepID=A0A2H0UMS4_9BACT|nr:MAG: hypothetical protein COU10_03390 [Candidatus Harrisonbacteria bacterium CG10_big_fil_rev_8_21_14_0_10_45_28]
MNRLKKGFVKLGRAVWQRIVKENPGELTILTKKPRTVFGLLFSWVGFLKELTRKVLFFLTRSSRFSYFGGPRAVLRSLVEGLKEQGVAYCLNPWHLRVTDTVGVLSDVSALKWALEQKKTGRIKTLVAGPNLVVSPDDHNKIMKDPLIDRVIVPSEWDKRWWVSFDQYLGQKTVVWPAGVKDVGASDKKGGFCLVYVKNAPEQLVKKVIHTIWERNVRIRTLHYGRFTHGAYLRLLKKAKFVIYLSAFESQGIALLEAWMANVPTLAWSCGQYSNEGHEVFDEKIGAPYLTEETGSIFKGVDDFQVTFTDFLSHLEFFSARKYVLGNLTDRIAAVNYLRIIDNAKKDEE